MINEKQRLLMALGRQKGDRPPFICPGGMMNMVTTEMLQILGLTWPVAYGHPQQLASLARRVAELSGIENLGVPFCMTVEAESLGASVHFGSLYSEPHIVSPLLTGLDQWRSLPGFDFHRGRMAVVLEAVQELARQSSSLPIIASITGPISLAATLLEPMDLFRVMFNQPAQLHDFLKFLTQNLIEYARVLHLAGADVLVVADPSASGDILGARCFSTFALPYLNWLTEESSREFDGVLLHICGRLNALFPMLKDLHVSALSIDSATSVTAIGRALPGKVIVGNVSTQLLEDGSPEMVKQAALTSLKLGAKVLAPACGLGMSTPLANLRAMAEVAINYNPGEE